jgi:hypothetical protein
MQSCKMLGIMSQADNLYLRSTSPLRWAFLRLGHCDALSLCPFCYALEQSIIQLSSFVKGELVVSDAIATQAWEFPVMFRKFRVMFQLSP